MATPAIDCNSGFGPNLRAWRQLRRMSQLELSLNAEISQRHLSWLETGRSRPSRRMVVQLAEALDMPLRARNRLLEAAGFAALYRERGLDEQQMTVVRDALRRMLDVQLPYPSLVVDREWNILMTNAGADALLVAAGGGSSWEDGADGVAPNLALLTLHPRGLRRSIANWDEVGHHFVQRLRRDLEHVHDAALRDRFSAMIELADAPGVDVPDTPLMPMLTIDLRVGDGILRLFSVITTFGTAQDVTAEELRIESFLPLDAVSDDILRRLVGV